MKVLRMNKINSNEYALIFTISHSISDGRNCFSLVAQFLNIFEKVMFDEKRVCEEIPLVDSSDMILKKLKDQGILKINRLDLIESYHTWSSLVNRVTAKSGYKLNGVNGRVEHFCLENSKVTRLIQKMKTNSKNAKLTSLLIVIICIAFKRTCLNNRINDIPLEDYVIAVPVCLRSKLKIDSLSMGCHLGMCDTVVRFDDKKLKSGKGKTYIKKCALFILRFLYILALSIILPVLCFCVKRLPKFEAKLIEKTRTFKSVRKINEANFEDNREDFWLLVEKNSLELQKTVANNSELDPHKKDIKILDTILRSNFNFSSFNLVNFCVSNLGKMETTPHLAQESRFKIVKSYVCQPCLEKRFSPSLYFGISTVDGNLCCAISYSEKIYTKEFIQELKLLILKLIDDVIK